MINTQDQEDLFKLIAEHLKKDITCIAIGGTAMLFLNYKNATKDIDLIFQTEEDRKVFVKAIEELGYKLRAIGDVYDEKRRQQDGKPIMYTRGDERFDLFVKNVFGFPLEQDENVTERHDFPGKNEFTILIPGIELIVLLKSITGREKDHEDIEAILKTEKNIDWEYITTEAIKQRKKNSWILLDLEETMQLLKKQFFIPSKHFYALHKAQKK